MPLQYPLVFPYGTNGWSLNISCVEGSNSNRKNVTMREFIAFLVHCRLDEGNILLWCGRLFLQFVVNCYTAIEAWRLRYFRDHQGTLQAKLYCGLKDTVIAWENDAYMVGKRLILPALFTGRPRYMRQHVLDAMVICNQMGYSDFFVTLSCNLNWPEIQEALSQQPGQHANNWPDIVNRVFGWRLKALKQDFKERNLFAKVIAGMIIPTPCHPC